MPQASVHVPGNGQCHARGVEHSHDLIDRLRAALDELGIDSLLDEDGDLAFEYDGTALFIRVAEDDSAFRVFGLWERTGEAEEVALLRLCNDLTLELLLVKVSLQDGDVVLSVDQAVDPDDPHQPLAGVLPVLLDNLLHGVEAVAAAE